MKTKALPIACCILLTCYSSNSNAQNANRTLSNLTSPTAVNQSLIPGTNNTINLGSGGRGGINWNNLYLGKALYLDGEITLHAPGYRNFFAGPKAGNTLVVGIENIGVGQLSLFNLTTGNQNSAFGYSSLYYNTTGDQNTASGCLSLYENTIGVENTAYGFAALYSNTNGTYNTACGQFAMNFNISGSANTALGGQALLYNTTGFYNTAVGYEADVSNGNLSNATAIGYGAVVDAPNRVRIGNSSVISIGGPVSWTIISDGRYKKDIKENVAGLAFINSLRPITYTVNVQGLNEYYNKGRKQLSNNAVSDNGDKAINAEMKRGEEEASKIVYNGFIAQEVEEAAKKLNFEFSGVDKPQSEDGLYGLRYDNFVVPLVKAVQELSKLNEALQKQNDNQQKDIDDLKSEIRNLKSEVDKLKSATISGNRFIVSDASLSQNIPNPFTNTTTISYSLPARFSTAEIIITDKSGKQLKQINISDSGNGIVNIGASALLSGVYNYSLIVDGRIISTKQMIVAK